MASKFFNLFGLVAKCAFKDYTVDWNQYPGQENVVKLDDQNIQAWISSQRTCIVFFYSKSCTYCETLKPGIADTASQLKAGGSKCTVGTIDGSTFRAYVKGVMNVNEVPTINIYKSGQFYTEYKFERRPSFIINYLKKEGVY